MFLKSCIPAALCCAATAALADDMAKIESALSAGPDSLAAEAAVMDWDGRVLREGSNGWTCLPDRPDNGGTDPFCVDAAWLNLLEAARNEESPSYGKLGIAYMLMGDAPVSNVAPGQSREETPAGHWVEGLGAHLMLVAPDRSSYDNLPTDPMNGGPWIMWPGTPFEHIMVPIDPFPPG